MSARKEILVVDKKGRPQASQVVGLYNNLSALVATATTDSYGMATFASIADGLYSVYGTRGAYTTRGNQDVLVFDPANYIGSTALVTDHGTLTGLTDDDHTQYSLVDGTRTFTGKVMITPGSITMGVGTGNGITFGDGGTLYRLQGSWLAVNTSLQVNNGLKILGIASIGRMNAGTFYHNGSLGFYGTSPIAKPTSVTATASSLWKALSDLGLIA